RRALDSGLGLRDRGRRGAQPQAVAGLGPRRPRRAYNRRANRQGDHMSYQVKVEDIEYLRHGNTGYLATLYRPQGSGPFPIMVELHGGAWCRSDRHGDKVIHEALAKSGVIVATLDWRQPPTAPYPASFQDIHYGIRWIKSKAAELGSRPDMVGSMGNSSGGPPAMLLGMRPFDPPHNRPPPARGPAPAANLAGGALS